MNAFIVEKNVAYDAKKCEECGESVDFKERENLSDGEQKYIKKKLAGMRILTFFLPPIGMIRCRRWGCFFLLVVIWGVCSLIASSGGAYSDASMFGGMTIILSRLIPLICFSKKAYTHDKSYFQKYLDDYNTHS